MTDKEMKKLQETLPKWKNGVPPVLTFEQTVLQETLDCRDMINSILCYQGMNNITENRYLKKYFDSLGTIIVSQLINEQIQDVSKSQIVKNVYTDSEGCSYNNIIWYDE